MVCVRFACLFLFGALLIPVAEADDWLRFRGPNGTGVASGSPTPTTWSETENLKWKRELPGKGASSPIVVGDKVFVTCYSGYGVDRGEGSIEELSRHLVCVDRSSGEILWTRETPASMPEDPYSGAGVPTHGYASNTPTSDGERIFVFYGKSGVLAFDLEGNELWKQCVGTNSGRQRWGSGASLILTDDLVVVNASDEDEAIYGLNKENGEEVWKSKASGIASTWGTPVIAEVDGKTQILILVPYEVWSLNPENGKLIWYSSATEDGSINTSLIPAGDFFIAMGERGGTTVALKAGGKDDVSEDNVLWTKNHRGRISTPVVYNEHMFWVSNGIANCVRVSDGETVYQERLNSGGSSRGRESEDNSSVSQTQERGGQGSGGQGSGGQGRGQGRGGFGGQGRGGGDYGSPVAADGKIYSITSQGIVHVIAAKPEFELLATNSFESDSSGFASTPAISDGEIFIRSHKYLYCIGEK